MASNEINNVADNISLDEVLSDDEGSKLLELQQQLFQEIQKPLPTLEQIEEEFEYQELKNLETSNSSLITIDDLGNIVTRTSVCMKSQFELSPVYEAEQSELFENISDIEHSDEEFIIPDEVIPLKKEVTTEFQFIETTLKRLSRKTISSRPSTIVEKFEPLKIINPIIDNAVDAAVKKMLKDDIKKKLNRKIIVEKIFNIQKEIISEKLKNTLLNKYCVIHMKSKKRTRPLTSDATYFDTIQYNNYLQKLNKVDDILAKSKILDNDFQSEIIKIQDVLEKNKEQNEILVKEFENLIVYSGSKCFSSNSGHGISPITIEKIINSNKSFFKQISEFQFKVIFIGHKVATLNEEVDSLNTIKGNLKLQHYENLLAEIKVLQEKLETTTKFDSVAQQKLGGNDINNLKEHFNQSCHLILHKREKIEIYEHELEDIKPKLINSIHNQQEKRKALQGLRTKRDQLRNFYQKLNYTCGLLNKPALLNDFEKVLEKINAARVRVNKLENEYKRLTNLIDKLKNEIIV